MKFITAEQFLKANIKVQQAILEWWKPSVGDLVFDKDNIIDIVVPKLCIGNYTNDLDKNKTIPLLTVGQLIEFIEYKTDCKIEIEIGSDIGYQGYNVFLRRAVDQHGSCEYPYNVIENLDRNLLQALWQVACEIILNTN